MAEEAVAGEVATEEVATEEVATEEAAAGQSLRDLLRLLGRETRPELKWKGVGVPAGVVSYLEGVLSLMERRKVGITELLQMIERISRQRSMDRRGRMDYILSRLHAAPP